MVELLFIEYDGEKDSQIPQDRSTSRHTHAARQYHRDRDARQRIRQHQTKAPSTPRSMEEQVGSDLESRLHSDDSEHAAFQGCPGSPQDKSTSSATTAGPLSRLGISFMDPFAAFDWGTPGNDDPFVQHSLDFFVTNQLLEFRTAATKAAMEVVRTEVMERAIWHTGIRDVCIYGGMINKAYHIGVPLSRKYRQFSLEYKQSAIQHIQQVMTWASAEDVPEETMAVMLRLAVHGPQISPFGNVRDNETSNTYFINAQNTEFYLHFEPGWEHLKALFKIIDARGGLQWLKVSVLRSALQIFDIFCAWRNFQAPHFALPDPTGAYIAWRRHQEDLPAKNLLKILATGFHPVPASSNCILIRTNIHNHAAIITADYDQVLRNKIHTPQDPKYRPDESLLKYSRWIILHDLLSLPDPGLPSLLTDFELQQESYRHIMLAHAFIVLVPLPSTSKGTDLPAILTERILGVVAGLVARATTTITTSPDASPADAVLQPATTLCIAVWAGICAKEAERKDTTKGGNLRSLAASYLCQTLSAHSSLPRDWEGARAIMRTFLWLDLICDARGREVWDLAGKRRVNC